MTQAQRWTGVVSAHEAGGFVAYGDYLELLDRLEKAEKDAENMYSNMCRAQQEAEHLYRSRYEATRQEAEQWKRLYEATMEAIAKQAWATTPSPIFITNPAMEASK